MRSTLGLPLAERLIVVAQGIEFHNADMHDGEWRIPDCLLTTSPFPDLRIPGLVRRGPNEAEYTNQAQKVKYTIRVTTNKTEFHEYLERRRGTAFGDNVLVMYDGHARYGRGPCMGSTDAPGNHWGSGDDPRVEGIFRMGYPYLYVPVTEILHHEYKAVVARQQTADPNLSAVDIRTLNREQYIHPHLRRYVRNTRLTTARSLADLDRLIREFQDSVAAAVAGHRTLSRVLASEGMSGLGGDVHEVLENRDAGRNSLRLYVNGATGAAERFWVLMRNKKVSGSYWDGGRWHSVRLRNPARSSGRFAWPHIILHADWRHTVSGTWTPPAASGGPVPPPARMDVGATRLRCRGFCHFGCSTKVHNHPVVRGRGMKNWRRSADRDHRLAFWTTEAAFGDIGPFWLYHMLTYIPGRFRGYSTRRWGAVVRYARNRTNADLRTVTPRPRTYRVI